MPPPLALLLCTAFVLFLLRIERRQSQEVSAAMWIPTLWMLLIASKPLGIWFGSTGDAEAGSPLDRLVLSVLGIAGFLVLGRRQFDWRGALSENRWLMLLLGYMLVSTLWSDITLIAIKRWMRQAILVIMALVILSEPNPRQALESVLRRSVYVLVPFSIMLIKYYPALGVEYGRWSGLQMWIGVTVHKNCLGRLCLIAAFYLLWTLHCRWQGRGHAGDRCQILADVAMLLIALYLLKGAENAYSATSLAAFTVGIASFFILAWLRKQNPLPKPVLMAFVGFLIGFGVVTPFVGGSNVASFSSTFGRDESLTGRTEIWKDLIPVVQRQPLLGVGFGSFWTSARREAIASHAHNGYLDILLEMGVVGLAFYAALLLSWSHKLHAALGSDYDWASLGICFLLMTIVYNFSESTWSGLSEQMTAIVILLSLAIPAQGAIQPAGYVAEFPGSSTADSLVR